MASLPTVIRLDLFFNVKKPQKEKVEDDDNEQKQASLDSHYSLNLLPQLLEVAWSHDPLTTLKLIFNLNSCHFHTGKWYTDAFYTAAFWLHKNHPKTLVCNIDSFSTPLGNLWELIDILYRLLGEHAVMDLFLKRLESDVDKIMQHKLQLKSSDYLTDEEDEFKEDEDDEDSTFDPHRFVTEAAACLVTKHPTASHTARSVLLCESIAKRLFTPKSDQSYELEEWEKFRKLVLAPLRNYWYRQGMFDHRWSWVFEKQKLWHLQTAVNSDRQRSYEVEKYLEEVKVAAARGGGGIGIIKPDALVLGEIIKYVCYADFREVVELQWKAMVEDINSSKSRVWGTLKTAWQCVVSLISWAMAEHGL
ncbi:uncharacterized protein LOC18775780 [Prunus persica]|uniref:uncharacterized protein LOC18775780 n=1 Tax=Prunus persica TaxID=3760 RepID=UPI0009AB625D|nr:uncharacterized protein LOC18775780 [Prunus persica]